jgi:2-polyprenyl-6-methoxyphenol hydroxylase-like FAD-dependent oxidoreductase
MIKQDGVSDKRELRENKIKSDIVIVGGGMAGTCCAITAARAGLQVTLVQDRPVLGGNASSEIRLWILGATSHMGNNNRWAREGGVIDEILVENLYRNPEGNPLILDTILLEKVTLEPNIKLLLNTSVHDLEKRGDDEISSVRAFCSQNSTSYALSAPFFVDASGDGILGFLAGAAFRMGAEKADEFDEAFAPDHGYGELLGHSLYFYSKATDKPVRFISPTYAHKALVELPRFKSFNLKDHGCRLWWVEYGGRMDTIHESETIKWELWKVIYGIWDHLKNSGEFPEMANHTLEWVGTIPGKRESRRFEGDYMLHQRDLVEQREHADAVSFGGWALDLHPADGVYGDKPGCTQWHAKGVYQIPLRTMYSRNIKNLFLGGRSISASHVAFGSSRVMATCAHNAQAVALAAKLCVEHNLLPRDISTSKWIKILQKELLKEAP